jgi:hypothetical protein
VKPDADQVCANEINDAVRYERGLAVKCLACILLVAVVLVVRIYLFG